MQLARAQSDNPSLTIANIRLSDVIDQSLSSNRPVAQTKSIDLCFELAVDPNASAVPGLPSQSKTSDSKFEAGETDLGLQRQLSNATVRADAEAALTIINNLISNAIRYTPNGGKVTVGIRDAEQFFSVYVHDTGVGISQSDQKRVFERFYRIKGKAAIRRCL